MSDEYKLLVNDMLALEERVAAMEHEIDGFAEEFDRQLDMFAELSTHIEGVEKYLSTLEELMRLITANQMLDEVGGESEATDDAKQSD